MEMCVPPSVPSVQPRKSRPSSTSRKGMVDFGDTYNSPDLEQRAIDELEQIYDDAVPQDEDKMMGFLENMSLDTQHNIRQPASLYPHVSVHRIPHKGTF